MTYENKIQERLIELISRNRPESVDELVKQAEQEYQITKNEALSNIKRLQKKKLITLFRPDEKKPTNFIEYLYSRNSQWFWATITISLATVISTYLLNDANNPLIYLRYMLGIVYIVFLPGFCFIKILFPNKEIYDFETMGLSIGTSLVLIPLSGLLLNYTPWGIEVIPMILSINILTIGLSIIGIFQEFQVNTTST